MPIRRLTIVIVIAFLAVGYVAIGQTGIPQPQQPQAAAPGAAPGQAVAPLDEATYRQQIGYMLGQNVGSGMRENEIQCDLEAFIAGFRDGVKGAKPKWTDEQLIAARERWEQEMQQKAAGKMQEMQQAGDKNDKAGKAFLAANKAKEGVQTTASGLQYKVLKQGNGASPTLSDTVKCHYRGTLIDGTEFDSSYKRGQPAEFPVKGVIPGWTEALQKMRVGDKWQLFVPSELAYGADAPGPPIEPNSLLIFEVELLGINGH